MASKKFHLRIITPDQLKVDADVTMVIMRCIDGDMGILAGHQPCVAGLRYGIMRIINGDAEKRIALYGGIASVRDNNLTILTDDAHWPDEIDRDRAEADREHAELFLKEQLDSVDLWRRQAQLRRALVQIEISSEALVKK